MSVQLQSYYIFPDNSYIKLSGNTDHIKFTKKILKNTLHLTDFEILSKTFLDLENILLKSGFIRVTKFLNQVGIDILNLAEFRDRKFYIEKMLYDIHASSSSILINFIKDNNFHCYKIDIDKGLILND